MFKLLFLLLFISANNCFAKEVKFHKPETEAEKTLDLYFRIMRDMYSIKSYIKEILPEFYNLYTDKTIDFKDRRRQIVEGMKTTKLKQAIKEQGEKAESEKKRYLDERNIEYDPLNTVEYCISDYPPDDRYRTIYETDDIVYIEWKKHNNTYIYRLKKIESKLRIDGILCPSNYDYYNNYNNLNYQPLPSNFASQDFGK